MQLPEQQSTSSSWIGRVASRPAYAVKSALPDPPFQYVLTIAQATGAERAVVTGPMSMDAWMFWAYSETSNSGLPHDLLLRDIRHAPVTRDGEIPPPTDRTGGRRGSSRA